MVNIGVGPSNAKTITDHLAVLRPDLVLMIGHCAGLRNHQEIGDLVLATAYMRDDRVLDDMLPLSVPVVSNHTLNTLLLGELTARGLRSRMGIVFTTANRNWELQLAMVADRLRLSRALAVDMESATVAANGFRYRIPTATLLAVSDKPLHARPKLSADAQDFYAASRRQHVEIAISVAEKVRQLYPGGLPTADLRSPDEPLLGLTGPSTSIPLIMRGILAVIVGIIAATWPSITVFALVMVFAVYAFMDAGLEIAQAFGRRTARPVLGHSRRHLRSIMPDSVGARISCRPGAS